MPQADAPETLVDILDINVGSFRFAGIRCDARKGVLHEVGFNPKGPSFGIGKEQLCAPGEIEDATQVL